MKEIKLETILIDPTNYELKNLKPIFENIGIGVFNPRGLVKTVIIGDKNDKYDK